MSTRVSARCFSLDRFREDVYSRMYAYDASAEGPGGREKGEIGGWLRVVVPVYTHTRRVLAHLNSLFFSHGAPQPYLT